MNHTPTNPHPMIPFSDKLLMEFTQGNTQAFNEVFDNFRMPIFYFVKKIINDSHTAEEITSDTFLKLYRRREKFTSYNTIKSFLYITARNATFDHLKQRQRRKNRTKLARFGFEHPFTAQPMSIENDTETELLHLVFREIETLPSKSRQVAIMFLLEGKTVPEIANIMKIKTQSVSNQKTSAIKLLRTVKRKIR